MSDELIQAVSVTRQYTRGGETLRVLDELEFSVARGAFTALMGPSGSGKTTLLNLIGGLDRPDGGQVLVDGVDIGQLSDGDLARWRADHIGFVFQGFNLIPVLSAVENVMLPLLLAPVSRKDRRERAAYALELVDLGDRMKHRPSQLSGGQEQRVAIARALVTDPTVLLADEPTGDLDRESADNVMELLRRLNKELGKTILMVTHDPQAARSAQTIAHLDKGRLGRLETVEADAGAPA